MKYEELKLTDQSAVTSSGNSGAVSSSASEHEVGGDLVLYLDATSGTGTMDIEVFGVVGGQTYSLGSFTQVTGVTKERLVIANAPKDVRFDWTIGGATPSFDFTVRSHRSQ